MIDATAIEVIQRASEIERASAAIAEALDSSTPGAAVALPNTMSVHDLERYLPFRRRQRAVVDTPSLQGFACYVRANAAEGCTIFVAPESMQAHAVLDLGGTKTPGHAEHTCTLRPPRTAAYDALMRIVAAPQQQRLLAEWMEDWATHLVCRKQPGDEATIGIAQAVAAVRKISIESLRKASSEVGQLSAERSALEAVRATSEAPLPTWMEFACEPYPGLPERTFGLRLSILTGDKDPTLKLSVSRLELHQEQMAQQLMEAVNVALASDADDIRVVLGTFKRVA